MKLSNNSNKFATSTHSLIDVQQCMNSAFVVSLGTTLLGAKFHEALCSSTSTVALQTS